MPSGYVTFERRCMEEEEFPDWADSDVILNHASLRICSQGRIEREGVGMLQVS